MHKSVLVLPIIAVTAACQASEGQSTLTGAATGAALGAAINDEDRLEGALIGGAVGTVAGNMIGRANTPGDCIYTDQYGNRYVADCP